MLESAPARPAPTSRWRRAAPALTLLVAAPLVAEVLPGATRFSALFVLPIEICVWGGGAVLVRDAVRRRGLGWVHLLLLALALAVAEECIIQQTSLAPLVIRLKGQEYARAFGFNYVYFLWAVVYEAVFVVVVPVYLVEMIFPDRAADPWLGTAGIVVLALLFLLGSFLAWFTWTRIARPNVFHVPAYNPPLPAVLIAVAVICGLVGAALGPFRAVMAVDVRSLRRSLPWLVVAIGAVWAVLWYGLMLLAFGIAPAFPPLAAVVGGLLLIAGIMTFLPRWFADPHWHDGHTFAVIFGTILGSMLVSFIGFIGAAPRDLYFKIAVDVVALVLLIWLGWSVRAGERSRSITPHVPTG